MNRLSVYKKSINFIVFWIIVSTGMAFGLMIARGLFLFWRGLDLPYNSNPDAFYGFSLMPLIIFVVCFLFWRKLKSLNIKDFIGIQRFGIKEFTIAFVLGGSMPIGFQSLIVAWAWLNVAIK